MTTSVINIRNKRGTADEVYIGRAGKGSTGVFGNPIEIGKTCMICGNKHDRGGTLVCFRIYLMDRLAKDPEFRKAVKDLKGKTLVCFCKPLACHGDVLAEVTDSM